MMKVHGLAQHFDHLLARLTTVVAVFSDVQSVQLIDSASASARVPTGERGDYQEHRLYIHNAGGHWSGAKAVLTVIFSYIELYAGHGSISPRSKYLS
jgi:hypothetical protein